MLKASHINVGATVTLGSIIVTGGFISLYSAFYDFLSEIDDADHHESSITKALHFRIPGAKHRGYSHSLVFNIGMALAIFFGTKYFYPTMTIEDLYILMAICLSHLCADIFTIRGVPLLWPFSNENYGIPKSLRITTGEIGEKLFTFTMSVVNIVLLFFIVTRYILPHTFTTGTYDIKLIIGAIILQIFMTYLLLKEEVKNAKGDIIDIFKGTLKIILHIAINGLFAYILLYLNQHFNIVNLGQIATNIGISGNTLLVLIGVAIFIPSLISVFKQIEKMAFPFASVINIMIKLFLIGFFAIQLI